jgi:hypothetical protein
MLTAKGTLGVALLDRSAAGEALLGQAADAGAGAARVRWTAEGATVTEAAAAAGLEVVVSGGAREMESWERSRHSCLEIDITTEGDRAALSAALERVAEETVVLLRLGLISLAAPAGPAAAPDVSRERVTALAVAVEGTPESDDPKRMEDHLRAVAAPLRAGGWPQPFWLTDLAAPPGQPEAQAGWLVRHAAHALALSMSRVLLRLPETDAEPVLQALRMLAHWLEGAERITWLARGQYRAEFIDRPNRYLLWAAPGITRLPSSFQGPLHLRDMEGSERRTETSHLKLNESPVLVERRGEAPD